ncbi:hypothetical protein F503_06069 [Ophiostoma piceae UAMH 11346]|uniref:Uncharacterized protein n=1 Tax=Ophiostoma piceae (strain UAMH 11346) TaxID=1262450 RepID=S3CBT2_OPHP1|nr:hypothetical protein F503_06069 [Ophiostoma piceae UAMH 11346]
MCLVLAAVAAPVSALSMSNFQLITASSVPFSCILAYDQQLSNCALSDFTQQTQQQSSQQVTGNTCSAACQSSIALAQQTIKTSCGDLVSGAGSSTTASTVPPGQSFGQSAGPTTETSRSGNAAPPSPTIATEAVPKKTQSSSSSNSADSGEVRGGGSPFDAAVVNSAAQRSSSSMVGVPLVVGVAIFMIV